MPAISKIFKTPWKWSSCVKKLFKKFEITGIYDPYRNWNWRHIWSPFEPGLQAYMVPNETVIAGIFGPYLDRHCKHNWSPLYLPVVRKYLNHARLILLYSYKLRKIVIILNRSSLPWCTMVHGTSNLIKTPLIYVTKSMLFVFKIPIPSHLIFSW